ncbi:MAG: metalloregulator ArsR/SmtB family transcription factor [Actinomycetota bacterium]|nr:metalloregulator ArsR/SmtB family transcription factor [Actinomycetota bacterium]
MRSNYLCLSAEQATRLHTALPAESELDRAVRRLGAFSDPTRLRVAMVLAAASELCVGDTAALLGLPIKLVSHHVRSLAERGLATKHRDGKLIRYQLTDEARALLEAAFGRALPIRVEVAHDAHVEVAR